MSGRDKVRVHQSSEDRCRPNPDSRRKWALRAALVGFSICMGLILSEVVLFAIGQPRFYEAHSSPDQFGVFTKPNPDGVVYINMPSSRIRFVYDGNPRGYFGPNNEIDHSTNSLGFRGPEFGRPQEEETFRLLFLGDSFTFGEGVKFEDTYAEVVAAKLRKENERPKGRIESFNLGVGGYNTTDSLNVLKGFGVEAKPDVVVLGYVINDAEPPLYEMDFTIGRPRRRNREAAIHEGLNDLLPPDEGLLRLRTAQLAWRYFRARQRNAQTIHHYRSLYDMSSPGWVESRRSLGAIITLCSSMDVPCYVVLFPILIQLDDNHPFDDIYRLVGESVKSEGGTYINLIDHLRGMKGEDLWVHPTDQHPNEQVHAIAGRVLADRIARDYSTK